jgi:hypothetical protein
MSSYIVSYCIVLYYMILCYDLLYSIVLDYYAILLYDYIPLNYREYYVVHSHRQALHIMSYMT